MCDELTLCEPYRHPDVVAWSMGQSPHVPQFADEKQRQTAVAMRWSLIYSHQANHKLEELFQFAEWTWGVGLTHQRPRFGDLLASDLSHERRKAQIEALLRDERFDLLEDFPEWQHVRGELGIWKTPESLKALLSEIVRPQRLPNHVVERRKIRRFLARWEKRRFHYLVFLLHRQVDRGRLRWEIKIRPADKPIAHEPVAPRAAVLRRASGWQPALRLGSPLIAWMQGRVHGKRPEVKQNVRSMRKNRDTDFFTAEQADKVRAESFKRACRDAAAGLEAWPEFAAEASRMKLARWVRRGKISVAEAGLIIAKGDSRIGHWLILEAKMKLRGEDPRRNRRYVNAMNRLRLIRREAHRLLERTRRREAEERRQELERFG